MSFTVLATVIFLLADGSPARKAFVSCTGVNVVESGNDVESPLPEGALLILDSRGASIMGVDAEKTITCSAWQGVQHFSGPVTLRNQAVTTVVLK